MTTKVVKGSLWTLVGLVVPIFFSLFATPINTRLLGAEGYGLFVLILLIPSYLSFADFGMNMASTKFASAAFADGDPEKEARVVRTAALIAFLGSLPVAVAMMLFARSIVAAFNVPEHLVGDATLALRIASVTYLVNFLISTFNTPQLARLRMDLNISITSGMRLLGIIATPVVIYFGGGVVGAVTVALAVSLLTLSGHLLFSSRLLPELAGISIDRSAVRPLLKFGGSLVVAGIAAVLLANLEKFVLTRATSVETLAYYSVAVTFAAMLTLFSASITQSIMPAFAQLQGEENRAALSTLYSRGIRLTMIWLIPAVVFMILVGQPFFTYWFGPDYGRESIGPYYITVGGLIFNVLAYFPYAAIMASGRSDIFAKIYWLELVPYIALVWVLASNFGAKGAALAWSIRVITDASLLFWLAHRVAGVQYLHQATIKFLAASLAMAAPLCLTLAIGSLNLGVVGVFIFCVAGYAAVIWNFVLTDGETGWLLRKLNV